MSAQFAPRVSEGRCEVSPYVMSADHYVLGPADRYADSVQRFASAFGWEHTPVTHVNATRGRPAATELPRTVYLPAFSPDRSETSSRSMLRGSRPPAPVETFVPPGPVTDSVPLRS